MLRERPLPNLEKAIESLRVFEISRTHKQVISGKEPDMIQHTEKRRNTYKPKGPRKEGKQGEPKKPPLDNSNGSRNLASGAVARKTTHGKAALQKTQSVTSVRKKATLPQSVSHPNASIQWIKMTALTGTTRWVKSAPTGKTSCHLM